MKSQLSKYVTTFLCSLQIVTDNSIQICYLCTNIRWAAGLCFKIPFPFLLIMRINSKTGTSYYSTEALLYWQKAADTMLWKKAYAVMDDG